MKKLLAVFLFLVLFLTNQTAYCANTRVTYPTALSVEFLGRGPFYSLNFDQMLSEKFAAGAGFSIMDSLLVPVYGNYYFFNEGATPFLTLGMTFSTNTDLAPKSSGPKFNFKSFPALVSLGLGYEFRSDQGFLARAAGYLIFNSSVSPWVGLSLGYCF